MAHMFDQVIDIISRPLKDRRDAEITAVIPWLRRRTDLMPQCDRESIMEVMRYCTYETADRDDVILKQGEEGRHMYIILQGTISVYIDASLTGEEPGDSLQTPAASPTRDSPENRRPKQHVMDRNHFGKFIIKYESGKHFGEAALVCDDKTRNATIMADEPCDLLVIDQHLFDMCLREQQEQEFKAMQNFVEHHPLFSHMSPKYKRLLELSLRRENFAFDTPIFTQGDKHTSLYFILSGQAKIFIEPAKHQKQYSHLWPFEVGTDIYSQEFEWLRESRRAAILRKYENPAVWPTKPDSLVLRRTEGYAASEKSMHEKTVCLCSVQDGEILGDTEVVMNLGTYMQTVICTANTQTLVLDVKNLERVTGRRNTLTMKLMQEQVLEKMEVRQRTQHGKQVPFLFFVFSKLTEEKPPEKKAMPALKTTKALPSKELQTQHMLDRYLQGKAELLEPCVPGTLIYKDIMEEKSRIRSNIRRRSTIGVHTMMRDARRKVNRRKPRSRREIVDSLKEMIEAELVEASAQGSQGEKKGSITSSWPTPRANNKPPSDTNLNSKNSNNTPRRLQPPSDIESHSNSNTPRKSALEPAPPAGPPPAPRRPSLTLSDPSPAGTPRRLSLMSPSTTPTPRDVPPANAVARKSSLTKDKSGRDTTVKKRVTLPALEPEEKENNKSGGKGSGKQGRETPRGRSDSLSLPQILEERDDSSAPAEVSRETSGVFEAGDNGSANSSERSRYVKREVKASSDGSSSPSGSVKRLPPLAKVELRCPEHVPNERWNAALKFVNERMQDKFTGQLLSGGSPKDYETSEASLQMLENRIKQFHIKHGQSSPVRLNLKLPKLRRFKLDLEDENQHLPKPGGKVWIKKQDCQIAGSEYKVIGHQHIRYHMVPELPEFDKVKKMQNVMQQLMDSTMRKKLEEQAAAADGVPSRGGPSLKNVNEHTASFV